MTDRRPELICRVKFCNNLPDIPFDPKFITYPFDSNRFVQYKPTSLEKNYKHDLLTEHDLGVDIDLINPETYHVPLEMQGHLILEPEDEKLIEEDAVTPLNTKRSLNHNKAVPWLKKTEYISTEFNRYGASSEKNETKVGYKIKKDMKDDNLYLDRDSQIAAIDKTFEEAKRPITEHHNKKGVTPVEILPIFPDFDLWKYPFAQVQFDSDPASSAQIEEMSQAMIRGVMDESGEQFVAYFLPTAETIQKRKNDEEAGVKYVDECEYEYKMSREYNWNVKSKASKNYEENYFFIFRDDCMVYNELETKVRLTKRRTKAGPHQTNSKLVVCHRPLDDQELKQQELRIKHQLQPPQDEEENEQMETDNLDAIEKDDFAMDTKENSDKEESDKSEEQSDDDSDKSDSEKSDKKDKSSQGKQWNNNLKKELLSSSSSSSEAESSDEEKDDEKNVKNEKSDKSGKEESSSSSDSDSD